MNYYRRYVGDYLRDTARLSMLEHGAYNLLLDYYYADEKPLPLDKDELYLMVRAMSSADRKAIDKILRLYFTEETDGYHQRRVDKEIAVSTSARTNGKLGGRPPEPMTKPDSEPQLKPDSKPLTRTETVTEHETETITGSGHPPTTNHQPPSATLHPPPKASASRVRKSGLPADFGISDRVQAWAADKGHRRLAEYLEFFIGYAKRSGKQYADWDEAFMGCIREDWPKLRAAPQSGGKGNERMRVMDEIYGRNRDDNGAIDGTAERLD